MEAIEFMKKAKEVSELYGGSYCFEIVVIVAVVKDVAENWIYGNNWILSSEIELYSGIGNGYERLYTEKLKKVLEKLGIEYKSFYVGEKTIIREPRFK